MRGVAFTGHSDQLKVLEAHRQGESDLVLRDGVWYLIATVDIPDAELNGDPFDFLGVDMGIVNIAASSDGDNFSGAGLRRYRKRVAKVRAQLQAKGTKSAKKKLKARSRREARAIRDTNHRIAKQLVIVAERTGRGIGVEDLAGIRDRVAHSRPARRVERVVLLPTPNHHRLQGETRRGPGHDRRRAQHFTPVPALRAHREGQPAFARSFRLPAVRSRWTRRPGSRGQRP